MKTVSHCLKLKVAAQGFTLIEILIALFIFTILSVLLVSGLHTIINLQSGSENKARHLRQLQMGLLVMSRDIEQAVNRPIINADGKEEAAFVGRPQSFVLTHMGFANPVGTSAHSSLQRTGYAWSENGITRLTWAVLDQAPKTKTFTKPIIGKVLDARFEYLDQQGRFHEKWPQQEGDASSSLPVGVKINLKLENWGNLAQFYVISAQNTLSKPSGDKQETDSVDHDKPSPQPTS